MFFRSIPLSTLFIDYPRLTNLMLGTHKDPLAAKGATAGSDKNSPAVHGIGVEAEPATKKRQLSDEVLSVDKDGTKVPICEKQGLASPPHARRETFTLGGQSDSTYEYLPKVIMSHLRALKSTFKLTVATEFFGAWRRRPTVSENVRRLCRGREEAFTVPAHDS